MVVDDNALVEKENMVDLILLVCQPLLGTPDEDVVEEERIPLHYLLIRRDFVQKTLPDVSSSRGHKLKGPELLAKIAGVLDRQDLLLALHEPSPLVNFVDNLLNKLLRLFDIFIVGVVLGRMLCDVLNTPRTHQVECSLLP